VRLDALVCVAAAQLHQFTQFTKRHAELSRWTRRRRLALERL